MDLAHGLHQPLGVPEPLLEQVGHALRAVLEQLERVLRVGVLREDHDPRPGVAGADLAGELDALGGEGRRHADVEQGDVGPVGGDLPPQLVGALRGGHDLELGLRGEHRPGPLPDQVVVLRDHDADRSLRRFGGRVDDRGRWRVGCGHARLHVRWCPSGRYGSRWPETRRRRPPSCHHQDRKNGVPLVLVASGSWKTASHCRARRTVAAGPGGPVSALAAPRSSGRRRPARPGAGS